MPHPIINPYPLTNEPWYTLWEKLHTLGIGWTSVNEHIHAGGNVYLGQADELACMTIGEIAAVYRRAKAAQADAAFNRADLERIKAHTQRQAGK